MATSPMEKVTNNSSSGYCKMPDGTLIQWGILTPGSKTAVAVGNLFTATYGSPNDHIYDYPISFKDNNYSLTFSNSAGSYGFVVYAIKGSDGIYQVELARPSSGTVNVMLSWLAIGRWK